MFSTNEIFKHPWSFDEHSADWSAVELSLKLPWFLIDCAYREEKLLRTFFFSSLRDVASFIETRLTGIEGVALNLVLPPIMSSTRNWLFVPIQRICRECPKDNCTRFQLILVGKDGVHYCESPFDPIKKDAGPMETMVEFK